jgi:hypothetical protein
MAKFFNLLGNLSGSIGANTFSRNRGGSYVKLRSMPTNPNSTRQQAVRNAMSGLSAYWKTLTAAQKSNWNSFAFYHPRTDPVGNSISVTGANYFVALNTRLVDSGLAKVDDAPTVTEPMGLLTFSVARTTATTVTVTYTATPLTAGHKLLLFMSLPSSGDRNPNLAQCRQVGYSAAAQASPWVPTIPFAWSVGQTVTFYGCIMGVDGQISVTVKHKVTA